MIKVCRAVLTAIGNIPPAEAEANFYATLETEPMTAYGEGRSSAFNDLVQGAVQQDGQSQERMQEAGIGQGLGQRFEWML